jgi:hypothetical protein
VTNVPENIEHFNLVVLKLLSRLYEAFPRPLNMVDTMAIDIGFSAVPEDATVEEGWDIGTMAEDIVGWLSEEGFLRYEADPNHQRGNFWKVRLTLKGLAILGYVPSSVSQTKARESLIERAKQAIGSAASVAGKETIKQVVTEIFKLALAPGAAIAAGIWV